MSATGRVILIRLVVGLCGLLVGVLGLLFARDGLGDVVTGAALAWGASVMTWAVSSVRDETEEATAHFRHVGEIMTLHGHLNSIGRSVGAPPFAINDEYYPAVYWRAMKEAHLSGRDELRLPDYGQSLFWNNTTVGSWERKT